MIKPNSPAARRAAKTVAQRLNQASLNRVAQRSKVAFASQQYHPSASAGVGDVGDWKSARQTLIRALQDNDNARYSLAYSLAQCEPDSNDSIFPSFDMELLDDQMKEQLRRSRGQLLSRHNNHDNVRQSHGGQIPLPRTLEDAIDEQHSDRALVVTETANPFRIVNVNKAWEGLCGYSYVESKGKTLGDLLQGEETDQSAVTAIMATLNRGEEAGTVLVNYTKEGRKFHNRLRVGPMMDAEGNITHFVGELQETKM
mmetsp:Transcript_9558/g.27250  ORF Transcript_9558/g.27250 Transcript_9558/m.27250 type:complete len:256 (+) Transcript_9558:177-944(+)